MLPCELQMELSRDSKPMHTLTLRFSPSVSSRDHQTRIFIDDDDWLGSSTLGIDPPEFFAQSSLQGNGRLLVGRCECGVVGCCDSWVEVHRDAGAVTWMNEQGLFLQFVQVDYDREVHRATHDYSWEDANRAAERRANAVLHGLKRNDGYCFRWASTRIKERVLTLSFERDGLQQLVEISWNGLSPDDAELSAVRFRESHPDSLNT